MSEKNEQAGPVEAVAVTQQGSTFAERKVAREKAEKQQVDSKQVDSADVEDKAVAKSRATKKS